MNQCTPCKVISSMPITWWWLIDYLLTQTHLNAKPECTLKAGVVLKLRGRAQKASALMLWVLKYSSSTDSGAGLEVPVRQPQWEQPELHGSLARCQHMACQSSSWHTFVRASLLKGHPGKVKGSTEGAQLPIPLWHPRVRVANDTSVKIRQLHGIIMKRWFFCAFYYH